MAQFTAQGCMRLHFNGDKVSFGIEPRDIFPGQVAGGPRLLDTQTIQLHKKQVRFYGSRRVLRSHGKKSSNLSTEERLGVAEGAGEDGVYYDEGGEFEEDELACFRGLVLDISYRPVNVVCWRRAICLEFMEKADVLEYYDQTVNSPSGSFYIPAVLRIPHLLQVVKRRRIKHNLSRKNIFFRDFFTCQYCSSRHNLTIDHVLPIARGGDWTWENLVTACAKCNSRKGQKTLEEAKMKLIKVPKAPKDFDILAIPLTTAAIKMLKMRKGTPEEWQQYLSKPRLES